MKFHLFLSLLPIFGALCLASEVFPLGDSAKQGETNWTLLCLNPDNGGHFGVRIDLGERIRAGSGGVVMARENSAANAIMFIVGIPLGLIFMTWTLLITWTAFVGGQAP